MATRDLHHNITVVDTILPALRTSDAGTVKGAAVNATGYESVEHVVTLGVSADVLSDALYYNLVLQDSPDSTDGNFVNVTNPDYVLGPTVDDNGVFAQIVLAGDSNHYRIGYLGPQPFTRVNVVAVGNHSSGTPYSAQAILGNPHGSPGDTSGTLVNT